MKKEGRPTTGRPWTPWVTLWAVLAAAAENQDTTYGHQGHYAYYQDDNAQGPAATAVGTGCAPCACRTGTTLGSRVTLGSERRRQSRLGRRLRRWHLGRRLRRCHLGRERHQRRLTRQRRLHQGPRLGRRPRLRPSAPSWPVGPALADRARLSGWLRRHSGLRRSSLRRHGGLLRSSRRLGGSRRLGSSRWLGGSRWGHCCERRRGDPAATTATRP